MTLLDHHLLNLRQSGLSDRTIEACGFYSESDPTTIAKILGWDRPASTLGPCLVIPYPGVDGRFNGYARIRPDKPRKGGGKYEAPKGLSNRAYLSVLARQAAAEPKRRLFIVEGEKKCVCCEQLGFPCIGLSGVWNWQRKQQADEDGSRIGDRELLDELAAIDWNGREVVLVFDSDPRRNPNVEQAKSELRRILKSLGATVLIVDLPLGDRDSSGVHRKQGLDDFVVAEGEKAFRELVDEQTKRKVPRLLEAYREEVGRSRVDSVGHPGLYLDTSPTGAGKSFADRHAAAKAGRSLTVEPTHRNCEQTENDYRQHGLDAVAYPKLDAETCQNLAEAERALSHGLSVSAAICVACEFRDRCDYRATLEDAENAPHRIATHQRACLSFRGLADGRDYISIHEDSISLLRPPLEVSAGLQGVAEVADAARKIQQRDNVIRDDSAEHFFWRMATIAEELSTAAKNLESTTSIDIASPAAAPRNVDRTLYRAMRETDIWPSGAAMQLVKAIANGEVVELVVRVDEVYRPGRQKERRRAVCAVKQTVLPSKAAVWLSDATASADEVEAAAGRAIINRTPEGVLTPHQPILQIVEPDIRKSTSAGKVVGLVRSLMLMVPHERIGIITDRSHLPAIQGTARKSATLDQCFRRRIEKITYFRDGDSRGSNEWHKTCDLLMVLGTPRVPPPAIRSRLIQRGLAFAASHSSEWVEWGPDYWSAETVSGGRRTVRTLGYRDHDWHAAHRSLVAAELTQAAGRGRAILEAGIPVIVVSSEDLGLVVSDIDLHPIGDSQLAALKAIWELWSGTLTQPLSKGLQGVDWRSPLTQPLPKGLRDLLTQPSPKIYLESGCVSSSELSERLGLTPQAIRKALSYLAVHGWVRKVGQRRGWQPALPSLQFPKPPPAAASPPTASLASAAESPLTPSGAKEAFVS